MKKFLTGLCALSLSVAALAACNQSGSDRVGEGPADRNPSASPSTIPPPAAAPGTTTTPPPPPPSTTR